MLRRHSQWGGIDMDFLGEALAGALRFVLELVVEIFQEILFEYGVRVPGCKFGRFVFKMNIHPEDGWSAFFGILMWGVVIVCFLLAW